MHSGDIAADRDVGSDLVQLPTYRQLVRIWASVRRQRQTVSRRDYRIGDDERFIEEGLQHRYAGAGNRRMAGPIRRVQRRSFRKDRGKQITSVLSFNEI